MHKIAELCPFVSTNPYSDVLEHIVAVDSPT